MTRPVCEITGRYLAEQKSPAARVEPRSAGSLPSRREDGQANPGTNNEWAQLGRAVVAQYEAFRGGMK